MKTLVNILGMDIEGKSQYTNYAILKSLDYGMFKCTYRELDYL